MFFEYKKIYKDYDDDWGGDIDAIWDALNEEGENDSGDSDDTWYDVGEGLPNFNGDGTIDWFGSDTESVLQDEVSRGNEYAAEQQQAVNNLKDAIIQGKPGATAEKINAITSANINPTAVEEVLRHGNLPELYDIVVDGTTDVAKEQSQIMKNKSTGQPSGAVEALAILKNNGVDLTTIGIKDPETLSYVNFISSEMQNPNYESKKTAGVLLSNYKTVAADLLKEAAMQLTMAKAVDTIAGKAVNKIMETHWAKQKAAQEASALYKQFSKEGAKAFTEALGKSRATYGNNNWAYQGVKDWVKDQAAQKFTAVLDEAGQLVMIPAGAALDSFIQDLRNQGIDQADIDKFLEQGQQAAKSILESAENPGMMTEAERDKMIAELMAEQKTGGGTYSEYAHAKPGDIINGHVVTQGDIDWAIDRLNTGGTGKTGQGFDANVLNGINQDPFNLSITMPVGTGTIKSDQFNGYDPLNPTNTSNGVTLTMNPNYGFEPGQEKKAYYDDEYEAKAALQNAFAQYGRGDNSLNNPQNINTTNSSNNKPTDTNPGTGTQTTKSVDDSSNDSSSDTDLGWNEETNKPNNPNNPGSDTTDGTNPNTPESDTIKDKNGETIDWDINKNRIGLSDDPNRANYDQADNSKWNRGMEFQSTNLVSDETVKSFISKTYKDDPIFKNAIRIIKEKKLWD